MSRSLSRRHRRRRKPKSKGPFLIMEVCGEQQIIIDLSTVYGRRIKSSHADKRRVRFTPL